MSQQVNFTAVEDFPYEVTDNGLVYSLPRVVTRSNGRPYTCVRKQLQPQFNGGHLQVVLYREGESVRRYVHILVLEGFVGPRPSPAHRGLHWDDDPYHNHVSNLYWGTAQDNVLDRVRNGRDPNARKEQCKRGHDLAGANLAPYTKKGRCCLACNRALGVARWHGRAGDEAYIQSLADEKFALIRDSEVVPYEWSSEFSQSL